MARPSTLDARTGHAVDDTARGSVFAGLVILALFFLGLGAWAALAPLSSAIVATAVIKVEGNRKTLQHLEGGTIKELRVREGDRAEAGQVLITLDDTRIRAEAEILDKQRVDLMTQEARLGAERDGIGVIALPDEVARKMGEPHVAAIVNAQRALMHSRTTAYAGQERLVAQKIAQANEIMAVGRAQLVAAKKQLESTERENLGLRDLFKQGYVPRQRMLELERAAAALEGQVSEANANIVRTQQLVEELKLQIVQLRNDRASQIATELRDVKAKLLEVSPRLTAATETLGRMEIRSPYSGYVVGLSAFSVGGVIQPGERIMDIVPLDGNLVVEATIAVDDVHELRAGLGAEVHLTAYKQRTTPVLHGRIAKISADRLTDARSGLPYYVAEVHIDKKELEDRKDIRVAAGMAAMVIVPTVERTVLDYIVSPLTQYFSRGLRER